MVDIYKTYKSCPKYYPTNVHLERGKTFLELLNHVFTQSLTLQGKISGVYIYTD